MFMHKVKKFCDHSMILWEMAGDLLTNGLNPPPPAAFRVKNLKEIIGQFSVQIWLQKFRLSGQTLKITRFQHFLGGLEDAKLKSGNFQSLTRKLSYSSFFSVLRPDLKNVLFGKIHWAPSEVLEVKRTFLRSWRPNFGFHLFLISFHLEFSSFWVFR